VLSSNQNICPVGAVYEDESECEAGNSPPDTGGVAAPSRNRCEASFNGADGVVGTAEVPRNALFTRGSILDHPGRSDKEASATSS